MSKAFSSGIGAAIGGGLCYALARFADKRQAQCMLAYSPSNDQQAAQTLSVCDSQDPIAIFATSTGIPWYITVGFGVLVGGVSGYAAGRPSQTKKNKRRTRRNPKVVYSSPRPWKRKRRSLKDLSLSELADVVLTGTPSEARAAKEENRRRTEAFLDRLERTGRLL